MQWFILHAPIMVEQDKAKAKTHPLAFNKGGALDVSGAVDKPWWTCKPEKAPADEFDFEAALAALFNRARKAQEQGVTIKGQDKLDKLLATVA